MAYRSTQRSSGGDFRVAEGPPTAPPALPRAVGLHARLWLRRLLSWRLLGALLVLAVADVAAIVGLARLAPTEPRALLDAFDTFALPLVAMVALGLGTTGLRRDADHGALDAFLLRPKAALALPIGRWLAAAVVVALFAWTLLALAGVGAALFAYPLGAGRLAVLALGLPLGAMAYAAIFFAVGAWSRSAAGLSLGWWLIVDLGLSRVAELPARLSVRPALVEVIGFDADLGFVSDASAVLWLAVAQLVALTAAAIWATCWRLRGDAPS